MQQARPQEICPVCGIRTEYAHAELLGRRAMSWNELHAYCGKCGRHFSNAQDPEARAVVWDRLERNVYPADGSHVERLKGLIPNVMNRGNRRTKEFQMCHERSEDAFVWSVFSALEEHALIPEAYRFFAGGDTTSKECVVLYWGCNDRDQGIANRVSSAYEGILQQAGEPKWRGGYSEPDILLFAPGHGLVTIEAKLHSPNDDKLARKTNASRLRRAQAMLDVGKRHVRKTSSQDWVWYELLRMWVPGCLLAEMEGLPKFTLVNLLPEKTKTQEQGRVCRDMAECAKLDDTHAFKQVTWEDFATEIQSWGQPSEKAFWSYFRGKLNPSPST